jgi:hypothetical protein
MDNNMKVQTARGEKALSLLKEQIRMTEKLCSATKRIVDDMTMEVDVLMHSLSSEKAERKRMAGIKFK